MQIANPKELFKKKANISYGRVSLENLFQLFCILYSAVRLADW
jgi:hypothetical protein